MSCPNAQSPSATTKKCMKRRRIHTSDELIHLSLRSRKKEIESTKKNNIYCVFTYCCSRSWPLCCACLDAHHILVLCCCLIQRILLLHAYTFLRPLSFFSMHLIFGLLASPFPLFLVQLFSMFIFWRAFYINSDLKHDLEIVRRLDCRVSSRTVCVCVRACMWLDVCLLLRIDFWQDTSTLQL